jgi:uncharacterized membrane protein (UPF0136 family)
VSTHAVWLALFLLGCYHGINPGMGWLFAVALGFQERSASAVLRAIVPLVLGHLISVAIVVLVGVAAASAFPHEIVHEVAAAILLAFGAYRLVRARHPRWVGMRVGFWGLALWGFLMSTAHGAGLMLLPLITANGASTSSSMAMPMPQAPAPNFYAAGWLMIAVHTFGYLLAMTSVALIVYTKVGVRFLRSAWLNVDLFWALALIVTGIIALVT